MKLLVSFAILSQIHNFCKDNVFLDQREVGPLQQKDRKDKTRDPEAKVAIRQPTAKYESSRIHHYFLRLTWPLFEVSAGMRTRTTQMHLQLTGSGIIESTTLRPKTKCIHFIPNGSITHKS